MKTERSFRPCDRYQFDFDRCHYKKGWAQLDTNQDASYYGNWVNPLTFELMSYCEGDVTHTTCDNAAEFQTALREAITWHRNNESFKGIDPMCCERMITAFDQLGFKADLH